MDRDTEHRGRQLHTHRGPGFLSRKVFERGLLRQGLRVVDSRRHTLLVQRRAELVARARQRIEIHPARVQVPSGVRPLRRDRALNAVDPIDALRVQIRNGAPTIRLVLERLELAQPDRARDVVHPVVEPDRLVQVLVRLPVRTEQADGLCE